MPRVMLDDSSTGHKYRNAMAFEALYGGGNSVTAYVLFMNDLVDSAADVELLLRKEGVLAATRPCGEAAEPLDQGRVQDQQEQAVRGPQDGVEG
jgi:hypothetical protein